jgi:hypothetical protein
VWGKSTKNARRNLYAFNGAIPLGMAQLKLSKIRLNLKPSQPVAVIQVWYTSTKLDWLWSLSNMLLRVRMDVEIPFLQGLCVIGLDDVVIGFSLSIVEEARLDNESTYLLHLDIP